jgi:Domain of Unknown Function (DUF1080)
MNCLSRSLAALVLVAFAGILPAQEKKEKKEAPVIPPLKGESKTIELFDGKTLNGWEGYEDLWSVNDGVIVGKNTKPLTVSTYLLTKDKYSDFRLIFSAKLLPGSETHSGVALWGSVNPEATKKTEADRIKYTYQGQLVMFPSGYGMWDLYRRNGLGVDGGPAKKVGKQHDWNEIEILAQGNRVRVAINGAAVVDWRDPKPELVKEGPIGLQLHSENGPQELHFKGLKLETFPKEDKLITVK